MIVPIMEEHKTEPLLECEKLWVFAVMIAVGGYLGAYTFVLRGGVFCNAQTANFVLLAVALGRGELRRAGYYLIPISAYLLGTVVSEALPSRVNRRGILRWDTFFVAFEMVFVAALGFVPDDAPPQICQVAVNFIASMQFNTFRAANRVPMATTFCTSHLRQTGVHLVRLLRRRDRDQARRCAMHLLMLGSFTAAAAVSAAVCLRAGARGIWGAELPLAVVFAGLLRADRGAERGQLHRTPHGHCAQ